MRAFTGGTGSIYSGNSQINFQQTGSRSFNIIVDNLNQFPEDVRFKFKVKEDSYWVKGVHPFQYCAQPENRCWDHSSHQFVGVCSGCGSDYSCCCRKLGYNGGFISDTGWNVCINAVTDNPRDILIKIDDKVVGSWNDVEFKLNEWYETENLVPKIIEKCKEKINNKIQNDIEYECVVSVAVNPARGVGYFEVSGNPSTLIFTPCGEEFCGECNDNKPCVKPECGTVQCINNECVYNYFGCAQCNIPKDCENLNLTHIECVGYWTCVDNKCSWECKSIPPVDWVKMLIIAGLSLLPIIFIFIIIYYIKKKGKHK